MQILIATGGVLPPGPVADLAERFLGGQGRVAVMTAMEVPRSFLDSLRKEEWRPLFPDPGSFLKQEAIVTKYVEERGRKLVEPVLAALRARAIEAEGLYVEGTDPAEAIIATATKVKANLIMMGATRPLFDEQSWGSVSSKVMHRVRCPLLLVPGVARGDPDEIERELILGQPAPEE